MKDVIMFVAVCVAVFLLVVADLVMVFAFFASRGKLWKLYWACALAFSFWMQAATFLGAVNR